MGFSRRTRRVRSSAPHKLLTTFADSSQNLLCPYLLVSWDLGVALGAFSTASCLSPRRTSMCMCRWAGRGRGGRIRLGARQHGDARGQSNPPHVPVAHLAATFKALARPCPSPLRLPEDHTHLALDVVRVGAVCRIGLLVAAVAGPDAVRSCEPTLCGVARS